MRQPIRKCKKMAAQNKFQILRLNDANIIGEHKVTKMKIPNMWLGMPWGTCSLRSQLPFFSSPFPEEYNLSFHYPPIPQGSFPAGELASLHVLYTS
jgi:hypothetical protein